MRLLAGNSCATMDLLLPEGVVAKRTLERRLKREAVANGNGPGDESSSDGDDGGGGKGGAGKKKKGAEKVEDWNEVAGDALVEMRAAPLEDLAKAINQLSLTLVEKDQGCVLSAGVLHARLRASVRACVRERASVRACVRACVLLPFCWFVAACWCDHSVLLSLSFVL